MDELYFFDRIYLFSTVQEFMDKKDEIRKGYWKMGDKKRCIYRMYVASRPFVPEYYRGEIWDWLNDYTNDWDFMLIYRKYKRKYGVND